MTDAQCDGTCLLEGVMTEGEMKKRCGQCFKLLPCIVHEKDELEHGDLAIVHDVTGKPLVFGRIVVGTRLNRWSPNEGCYCMNLSMCVMGNLVLFRGDKWKRDKYMAGEPFKTEAEAIVNLRKHCRDFKRKGVLLNGDYRTLTRLESARAVVLYVNEWGDDEPDATWVRTEAGPYQASTPQRI